MELKEFITQTLIQIQEGVQGAISALPQGPGVINPVFSENPNDIGVDNIQNVEFDVAVTVTDKMSGGGKAGIKVFAIELGGDGSKSVEQSSVSHIKFTVPIVPPTQLVRRPTRAIRQMRTDYDEYSSI